ncbi:hypothetical protein C5B42_03555 [Candidatus Cerribacteria bacterium 'Amazon FNV 2010 28 9']|uniref:Uncharacterized protein n=1 Tax=Candidatus Cerribacteria bacterium 'Amazon FNV 2010 28 9' TaxID=2081795 RepID=A0A317JNA2_9BACT|nr:MAG: hypothetical protein C5B42_03555 [Candidatus Cerribacteria bacterium 'Amazon FNV 2010 28 9']
MATSAEQQLADRILDWVHKRPAIEVNNTPSRLTSLFSKEKAEYEEVLADPTVDVSPFRDPRVLEEVGDLINYAVQIAALLNIDFFSLIGYTDVPTPSNPSEEIPSHLEHEMKDHLLYTARVITMCLAHGIDPLPFASLKVDYNDVRFDKSEFGTDASYKEAYARIKQTEYEIGLKDVLYEQIRWMVSSLERSKSLPELPYIFLLPPTDMASTQLISQRPVFAMAQELPITLK